MKLLALNSLKFVKVKRRLKLTQWQTVGLLEALWLFTQHNAPDGAIGRHSDEDIAAWLEWEGNAGELIRTLIETGWLDRCDTHRLVVHDWADHCPTYLKGAFHKNHKVFAIAHSTADEDESAKHGASDSAKHTAKHTAKQDENGGAEGARHGASLPCLALPNQTKPRVGSSSCSEPPPAAASERAEGIEAFPVVGGQEPWILKASKLREWQAAFPDLDVLPELIKARQWCVDNPAKRKTVRGMHKFLFGWLERRQNSGRGNAKPSPQSGASRADQIERLFSSGSSPT